MDANLLLSILLILAFGGVMTMLNRAAYILLFLLPASQVFGLIDADWLVAKGVFDYNALFMIIIIAGVAMSLSRLPELQGRLFAAPILVFMGLWLYGVLYPVYQHYSTLFYSLKASREFVTLLAYFSVFLVLRTQAHVEQGWRFIYLVALFYSAIEIAALPLGDKLMQYFNYPYGLDGEYFWHVGLPFWSVILIAFMTTFFEFALGASRPMWRLWLSGIGLLLTFFRSYLLAAMAAIPVVLLLSGQGLLRTAGKGMMLMGLLAALLLGLGVLIGGGEGLKQISEEFVISGVTEAMTDTGGSLGGRARYVKDREKIFEESPYLGYGFIDKESDLGKVFRARMTYGDTLGFVDKGDIDLKLKFGYVGTIVLVLTVLFIVTRLVRLARDDWPLTFKARCLSLATILLVFLIVQPVHAPLTYSFALLPFAITLGLVEREYYLLCMEQAEEFERDEEMDGAEELKEGKLI